MSPYVVDNYEGHICTDEILDIRLGYGNSCCGKIQDCEIIRIHYTLMW